MLEYMPRYLTTQHSENWLGGNFVLLLCEQIPNKFSNSMSIILDELEVLFNDPNNDPLNSFVKMKTSWESKFQKHFLK